MNGGDAAVAALIAGGVDVAFAVPGESYLPILNAIQRERNRIRLVTPRHESGCTFAADAYGKIARRPAAVLISRGPGATNAAIGVHTARQDSTPMVVLVGHVPRRSKGREAFQEVDHHQMFASLAKQVLEPASPDQAGAVMARAIRLATTGRPGPVVVVMPKDVSEGPVADADSPAVPPRPAPPTEPAAAAVAAAARLIDAARHPVVIAGEMVAHEDASGDLVAFAEASGAAICTAYRRQDTFPNDHPAHVGHLEINRAPFQDRLWAEADLIVAAGARLDGISTQDFTLIRADQRLIHIFPDGEALARQDADIALAADTGASLRALAAAIAPPPAARLAWRAAAHAAWRRFATPGGVRVRGAADLARITAQIRAALPDEAVVITDSGTFARWVHRYYPFTRPATQAGPMAGAMGYGVPGGLGASLAKPDAPTVILVGDGGFLMTGQELVTAVQEALPLKVIVCDNGAWGSILLSQQRTYGEAGIFGTRLDSPDFAAIARGYGLAAWTVTETAGFADAFAACLARPGPALIHLLLDRRDISPFTEEATV